jgi:hypothetical protein
MFMAQSTLMGWNDQVEKVGEMRVDRIPPAIQLQSPIAVLMV